MTPKTRSILLGAAVVALLGTSYLGLINMLCCAGTLIGALAGVWHYTSENKRTITPGEGALLGALAAVLGTIVAGLLNALLAKIGLGGLEALMQQYMERFYTEEQMEQIEAARSNAMLFVVGQIASAGVAALVGAVGGAIGAAVFKKGGPLPEADADIL